MGKGVKGFILGTVWVQSYKRKIENKRERRADKAGERVRLGYMDTEGIQGICHTACDARLWIGHGSVEIKEKIVKTCHGSSF